VDLPSGVVTFLMTDIEGSTRLWQEAPDAMRTALTSGRRPGDRPGGPD
jgi:class 3 adenylate cyclase